MQADDIFQEGLIQIFNSLKQFDESRGLFSTWSSRVMVNAALRYLKKYSWINSMGDLGDELERESDCESVMEHLAAKELTQMIQLLPVGYRMVFNMFAVEGYSHKEIAKELGISEGTSKSQLSKARRELRKQLESQLKISGHE